ncbi:MAG: LapA family protein [[Actinobacillus] rossii]|nr:LapA family protein [[Actinobacillus] rossii]MDY5793861.1 LapA family protein [[Actinobacillus] rossii]
MFKYIFGFVIVLAIVLVAITIGANNDQVITFNYMFAQSDFKLSTLVAILFGFGLILGWLITGIFYLKIKLKNMALTRQVKRLNQQVNEMTTSLNNKAA